MIDETYYDKNGLEIREGDLLKMYHFQRGRKKFYMYKYVDVAQGHFRACHYGKNDGPWLKALYTNSECGRRFLIDCEVVASTEHDHWKYNEEDGERKKIGMKKITLIPATRPKWAISGDEF
jgi:hypothetical protein